MNEPRWYSVFVNAACLIYVLAAIVITCCIMKFFLIY